MRDIDPHPRFTRAFKKPLSWGFLNYSDILQYEFSAEERMTSTATGLPSAQFTPSGVPQTPKIQFDQSGRVGRFDLSYIFCFYFFYRSLLPQGIFVSSES